MRTQRNQLADILIRRGVLTLLQLEQALQEQQRTGGQLVPLLAQLELAQEEQVMHALSEELGLPIAILDGIRQIPPEALRRVPLSLCEKYDVLPIGYNGRHNRLQVAMSDPTEHKVLQLLRSKSASEIDPHVAVPTAIRNAIQTYYKDTVIQGFQHSDFQRSEGPFSLLSPQQEPATMVYPAPAPSPPPASTPPQDPPLSTPATDEPTPQSVHFLPTPSQASLPPVQHEELLALAHRIKYLEHELQQLRSTVTQLEDKLKLLEHKK